MGVMENILKELIGAVLVSSLEYLIGAPLREAIVVLVVNKIILDNIQTTRERNRPQVVLKV